MANKGETKEKIHVEDTLIFRGKQTKEKIEREKDMMKDKEV